MPENFIRVHKSFCINIKYLKQISGNQMVIETIKIPIGKTYKKTLLAKLNNEFI